MSRGLEILAVDGLAEVGPGARLGELIVEALRGRGEELGSGDIVVVSQKAVSKAEGRVRDLAEVEPGERALELAERLGKDARLVELILGESSDVIRAERDVLIVETRGWICANAGIDASNVSGSDRVTLLPEDADRSARRIRGEIRGASTASPAVLIADSFGRPWRIGQSDVAIGCAGLVPLDDWRGRNDRQGGELSATVIAIADEVAAAADLARRKDSGQPACVVRGLERHVLAEDGPGARRLQRPATEDLFR
jgi:coenzyme F420-0:L-glutamate ligase / coenzyme F420-1:gamma-L-glutamate ligase